MQGAKHPPHSTISLAPDYLELLVMNFNTA